MTGLLSRRMSPERLAQLEETLREGQLAKVSLEVTPADTFYLTAEFRRNSQGKPAPGGRRGENWKI